MEDDAPRRLVVELDDATGRALDRMAATLGTTPEDVAARMLCAAAAAGVAGALKSANTRTWQRPRRKK